MPISEDAETALYQAFRSDSDPRLVAPSPDGAPSVEFKFSGSWRECRIWEGYFDAADILLKEAMTADNLIFPAMYSLRHAIEVALKWHIQYAGGVVPKRAGHNLSILIEALKQTAHDLDDEASYIPDFVLDRISELASIDPRSIAFRYSAEINGSPIEIIPQRWDLRRLYFMVGDLSIWFDGFAGQIDLSRDDDYQAYRRAA
jgi:hypothetical protein